ncbi:cyclin-dependent protein kinase inhibitor SMR3-like [Durio zibethinus]|uniref:Cyclin-dependent protein kinase inhibitor SMR3-like n=1 Tax=Durio zibethinus TaxID=66656 RepID=A0A6P5ZMP4_DURZI|nr:cyclin-dependent protein kinase inhibitor SMR3-like [Durio zibethinus]
MGVSNISEMFFSEKDLNSTMEISFLARPPLEFQEELCQIAPFQDVDDEAQQQIEERVQEQQEDEKEDKSKLLMSPLELKLPSLGGEFKVNENGEDDENNDGFNTPTSLDHKIPVMLKCPPAPRKPKSLPSPKQNAFRRRILLDLTKEIESLFPPALLADLGNKIKKVRQGKKPDLKLYKDFAKHQS